MMKEPVQRRIRNKKKPIPPFSFGERILVTGTITRVGYNNEETQRVMNPKPNRVWERDPFTDGPRQAVFLGFRRLADGWADYDSGEDGAGFTFTTSAVHKGALICIEGREPEKVFLDQCIKNPTYLEQMLDIAGTKEAQKY